MQKWKICPRCKGVVSLERDVYGWYEECIICGYQHDLGNVVKVRQHNPKDHPCQGRKISCAYQATFTLY